MGEMEFASSDSPRDSVYMAVSKSGLVGGDVTDIKSFHWKVRSQQTAFWRAQGKQQLFMVVV